MFVLDSVGLTYVIVKSDIDNALEIGKEVFRIRTCKLCDGNDGIVKSSEYALSTAVLDAGSTALPSCQDNCTSHARCSMM